jgi:hypothetical protein
MGRRHKRSLDKSGEGWYLHQFHQNHVNSYTDSVFIFSHCRGFRHEKTKKKRGTYRGGQIDLGTHSIKFENSDDE